MTDSRVVLPVCRPDGLGDSLKCGLLYHNEALSGCFKLQCINRSLLQIKPARQGDISVTPQSWRAHHINERDRTACWYHHQLVRPDPRSPSGRYIGNAASSAGTPNQRARQGGILVCQNARLIVLLACLPRRLLSDLIFYRWMGYCISIGFFDAFNQ